MLKIMGNKKITLVNVNAPVVATTSWWLHFTAPVVAITTLIVFLGKLVNVLLKNFYYNALGAFFDALVQRTDGCTDFLLTSVKIFTLKRCVYLNLWIVVIGI